MATLMSDEEKKSSEDWPSIIFVLLALPIAFTYGGVWVGLAVLVIGVVALGWGKRHEGPFPTNRSKEQK